MKKGPVENKKDADSDDELNEDMLDEFLDWRSKKSWRQQDMTHTWWDICDRNHAGAECYV